MSPTPSGLSAFSGHSLLIWSQLLWSCDRDNGSGRWGAAAPFSFSVPSCAQERQHLEGEGQTVKDIYGMNCQSLIGCGCAGEGREDLGGGRCRGGGCAFSYLAVRWVSATGLRPDLEGLPD